MGAGCSHRNRFFLRWGLRESIRQCSVVHVSLDERCLTLLNFRLLSGPTGIIFVLFIQFLIWISLNYYHIPSLWNSTGEQEKRRNAKGFFYNW
jgi:hypothetical protein